MNLQQALAKLESKGDAKRRAHTSRVGPDGAPAAGKNQFGVPMGDLRALAKAIKSDHALALELWKTGNIDAQLLAILILKPQELSAKQLERMVREARFSQVAEWLSAYVVKARSETEREQWRVAWIEDEDPWVARAGWQLTASRINRGGAAADGLDLAALLDRIEQQMPKAPPETQWTMNNTLIAIGVHHAKLRKRVLAIGAAIGLYKDWPVSKGCVIPYVPVCVPELVKRQA